MKSIFVLLMVPLTILGQTKVNDNRPVELGLNFVSADTLIGVNLYKFAGSQYNISLYDSSGNLIDSSVSPLQDWGYSSAYFAKKYGPGKYTVSYYTKDIYTASDQYYLGDSVYVGYSTKKNAGVFYYGKGYPTNSYNSSSYWIWPVFKSVTLTNVPLSDPRWNFVLVLPPDGGPVRFPDSTTLRKAIFGFDPPGPLLKTFYPKDVDGTILKVELYTWGNKIYKKVNGVWTEQSK